MAAGGVWLSAIDVARFVDALQPSHSVFLIELRTLCEIRYAIKILDLEKIAASLCPAGDDLRRHDFCKSPAVQCIAKRRKDCRLDTEDVADSFGAKRQRSELKQNIQP